MSVDVREVFSDWPGPLEINFLGFRAWIRAETSNFELNYAFELDHKWESKLVFLSITCRIRPPPRRRHQTQLLTRWSQYLEPQEVEIKMTHELNPLRVEIVKLRVLSQLLLSFVKFINAQRSTPAPTLRWLGLGEAGYEKMTFFSSPMRVAEPMIPEPDPDPGPHGCPAGSRSNFWLRQEP